MKTPEEMMELAKKAGSNRWRWESKGILDGKIYIPQGSYLGNTLISLGDTYEGSNDDCLYVEAACEFAPYAAEWMIKAKELLNKAIPLLEDAIEIMEDSAPYTARKTCELSFEINKFLESPHDQT